VVRKAIAMSLDRESNTDIRLGVVSPNETFWDALPAFVSPEIEPWPFDPEGAKQMLEDAGYVDSDGDGIREDLEGNPLVITQGNTPKEERQNYQAVAQQQLLEVGIDLQIFSYDGDILFGSYSDGGPAAIGDLDIMQWSDAPYFPDPDTPYWLCSEMATDEYPWGYNYYICDEYLDGLMQEQVVTTDPEARIDIFHDITKYMHDNLYYLGIWDDPDVWIVNPDLSNVKFSGITPFFNIAEWDFMP
jgi:peptide/nickel transport system substrate-binding protein